MPIAKLKIQLFINESSRDKSWIRHLKNTISAKETLRPTTSVLATTARRAPSSPWRSRRSQHGSSSCFYKRTNQQTRFHEYKFAAALKPSTTCTRRAMRFPISPTIDLSLWSRTTRRRASRIKRWEQGLNNVNNIFTIILENRLARIFRLARRPVLLGRDCSEVSDCWIIIDFKDKIFN